MCPAAKSTGHACGLQSRPICFVGQVRRFPAPANIAASQTWPRLIALSDNRQRTFLSEPLLRAAKAIPAVWLGPWPSEPAANSNTLSLNRAFVDLGAASVLAWLSQRAFPRRTENGGQRQTRPAGAMQGRRSMFCISCAVSVHECREPIKRRRHDQTRPGRQIHTAVPDLDDAVAKVGSQSVLVDIQFTG